VTLTLPRVGEEFAGYGLRGVLGRGGMSVVYEAENRRLGSTVALKVLAPELATDDTFRARFLKESRIAASLNHPNVIPIYDMGPCDDLLYIAMRYVSGADLRAVLKAQERLTPAQALLLVGQAARALDAAHHHGLVHRDVKPANFLVERGADEDPDHVYLADFGISKHAVSRSGLTATGQFVGTIDYIAPEQIQDKPVDGRADIYSLGCVLYECLTGQVPFRKSAEAAVIWAHVEELPPPPSSVRPELPRSIDEVIARALAKDPDERYGTCREFIAAVRDTLDRAQRRSTASASDGEGMAGPPTVLARETAPHPPAGIQGLGAVSDAGGGPAAPPLRIATPDSGLADAQGSRQVKEQPGGLTAGGSAGGGSGGDEPPAGEVLDRPGGRGYGDGTADRGPSSSRSRAFRGRARPIVLVAVALAIVAGVAAWVLAGGSSSRKSNAAHVQSPILQALSRANESTTAKGLLPPSSCKAQSVSMVMCSQPAFPIETVSFQTFASLAALYAGYVGEVKSLDGGSFRTNVGDCTPQKTSGELSWNHNYQHPRSYSLAQMQSGSIGDDQAAGRLFCSFSNSEYHLVWTMNDGRLLAILAGTPHDDAWNWWHGVHHAIDLKGSMAPSNMQMSNGHP
jgi:hypothetical protein